MSCDAEICLGPSSFDLFKLSPEIELLGGSYRNVNNFLLEFGHSKSD